MAHPIVQKILREGLDAVNTSMLSDSLRLTLLTEAADRLMHANRLEEAARAYETARNIEKLRETAEWLRQQHRLADAALFLEHIGSQEELAKLGEQCIAAGEIRAAKRLYAKADDSVMVEFLEKNF